MLPAYSSSNDEYPSYASEDSCIPFALNMFQIETSPLLPDGQRRPSFGSVRSSLLPELLSASSVGTMSPSTPLNSSSFSSTYLEPFTSRPPQINLQSMWNQQDEFGGHDFGYSLTSPKESSLPQYIDPHSIGAEGSTDAFHAASCTSFWSEGISPALSRPMFQQGAPTSMPLGIASNTHWQSSALIHTPPKTIDPSAFAQAFPITPAARTEVPSTPSRRNTRPSIILSSSPLSTFSPKVVPLQHTLDDSAYFDCGGLQAETIDQEIDRLNAHMESNGRSRNQSRLARRRYDRKGSSPGSKRRPLANKSGFECDRVITANSFACGYPECIDRNTGKQKRFKRAEHKKRHEKTVHLKEAQYTCWVPQCEKPFSRTDNLKSHLHKTHGKRSPGARNRYVATLDPNNTQYYSPDWQGELTAEGLPIRTRK